MAYHRYNRRRFENRPAFARAGSALRAASPHNPRNLPCPTCKQPNRLTQLDRDHGYQCDSCANAEEGCY
jgi:hypothetical protein